MTYRNGMCEGSTVPQTEVDGGDNRLACPPSPTAKQVQPAAPLTAPPNAGSSDRMLPSLSATRQQVHTGLIIVLLLAFGSYQGILYYGHQAIPNSDFSSFLRVGRALLSFDLPSSFKRAPVLGVLQVGLSHLVGGPHGELTAGWLLNAILHALSLPALWLVARRFIGRRADWFVLLTAVNPWVLRNLSDPIAETTLNFFIVLTFCAIFAQSRWRYVLAAVATMVRYDAAALIVVTFVLDMVRSRSPRRRRAAVLGVVLACVPLGLWMLGTFLRFADEGSTHYLRELGTDSNLPAVAVRFARGFWLVATSSLFEAAPRLAESGAVLLSRLVNMVFLAGFCVGVVQSIVKRQWKGIGLLLFLSLYLLVHSLHSFVLPRFCSTVSWIVLLLAFRGLQSLWPWVRARITLADRDIRALQILGCAVLSLWVLDVIRTFPILAEFSPRSASVPAVAIVLGGVFVAGDRWGGIRTPRLGQYLLLLAFCGMVVSNQRSLATVVGDGQEDIEFKRLADWCRDHTHAGDRTVCTYAGVLGLYLPERETDFIHPNALQAETLEMFTEHCRQAGVVYVTWDSRLGSKPEDRYYDLFGLGALAELAEPRTVGPYEFVTRIETKWGRYINVFYLRPLDSTAADS